MAAATAKSKTPFNFSKWLRSRNGQQAIVIILFSLIPLVLLFTFTYYPFAEMFKFSFYDRNYIKVRKFVGFDNYLDVFKRDDCFRALWLSLYYMGGAVIQLALALYLATVFCFGIKGGNFFKGCMFFPYLINGIAIGFIFKFFYTRGFVLDTVLQWIGFDLENLPYWLKDTSINNFSLVATSVWKYFGQNMVLFVGAMMSVTSFLIFAGVPLTFRQLGQQFRGDAGDDFRQPFLFPVQLIQLVVGFLQLLFVVLVGLPCRGPALRHIGQLPFQVCNLLVRAGDLGL